MQICSLLWVTELQWADGITYKPSCALACLSAADKRLYSLFFCPDSENEINRQAVLPRSLFSGSLEPDPKIWMTWSISNQESLSLVVM